MENKFQGEGTYSYACSNPDCFFCREVLIRPFLSQVELPVELVIPMKTARIYLARNPEDRHLTPYQRRLKRERSKQTKMPQLGYSFMRLDQTW